MEGSSSRSGLGHASVESNSGRESIAYLAAVGVWAQWQSAKVAALVATTVGVFVAGAMVGHLLWPTSERKQGVAEHCASVHEQAKSLRANSDLSNKVWRDIYARLVVANPDCYTDTDVAAAREILTLP